MPKVPRITGKEAISAFKRGGYEEVRTTGSHVILKHPDRARILSIPVGKGDVGVGLLKSQIKAAELTVDEFIELHKS